MKAFANGDRHEGEYCLDLRQGSGTYHWANGDCYEGDWEASYIQYVDIRAMSDSVVFRAIYETEWPLA